MIAEGEGEGVKKGSVQESKYNKCSYLITFSSLG